MTATVLFSNPVCSFLGTGKKFFFSPNLDRLWGPSKGIGVSFPRIRRPCFGTGFLFLCGDEVKTGWIHASTNVYAFIACTGTSNLLLTLIRLNNTHKTRSFLLLNILNLTLFQTPRSKDFPHNLNSNICYSCFLYCVKSRFVYCRL